MSDLKQKLIEDHEKSLKSVNVERAIPTVIDQHLLTIYDDNVIDAEVSTKSRARDACQILINDIFTNCTHVSVDGTNCAKLPVLQEHIMLPREKPLPAKKAKTKWQIFAETKGIEKTKKSRMEYDEETKSWVPRWGYKSKVNQKDREWAIEVPAHKHPNSDMFGVRANDKKENVAKNEFQRLRNIARNQKKGAMDPNILSVNPTGGGDKHELSKSFHIAKKSTASMGKFDNKVRGEDQQVEKGRKRKFTANTGNSTNERENLMKMVKEVEKGTGVLNEKKAAGRLMAGEQGQAGSGKKKAKFAAKAQGKGREARQEISKGDGRAVSRKPKNQTKAVKKQGDTYSSKRVLPGQRPATGKSSKGGTGMKSKAKAAQREGRGQRK